MTVSGGMMRGRPLCTTCAEELGIPLGTDKSELARPPLGAQPITMDQALVYEVFSSPWAGHFGGGRAHNFLARYFAKKAERKFNRYRRHLEERKRASEA